MLDSINEINSLLCKFQDIREERDYLLHAYDYISLYISKNEAPNVNMKEVKGLRSQVLKDIKEHNHRLGEITKVINKLNKSLEES
jgi:uncharacterized protein with HEPN domain